MTTKAAATFPNGYTSGTRSVAAAVRHAIAMSIDWGFEPVAIYQGIQSREYFGMVETIAGSMSDSKLVCWITAPEFVENRDNG